MDKCDTSPASLPSKWGSAAPRNKWSANNCTALSDCYTFHPIYPQGASKKLVNRPLMARGKIYTLDGVWLVGFVSGRGFQDYNRTAAITENSTKVTHVYRKQWHKTRKKVEMKSKCSNFNNHTPLHLNSCVYFSLCLQKVKLLKKAFYESLSFLSPFLNFLWYEALPQTSASNVWARVFIVRNSTTSILWAFKNSHFKSSGDSDYFYIRQKKALKMKIELVLVTWPFTRVYVRRRARERLTLECIKHTVNHGNGNSQVWGVFCLMWSWTPTP